MTDSTSTYWRKITKMSNKGAKCSQVHLLVQKFYVPRNKQDVICNRRTDLWWFRFKLSSLRATQKPNTKQKSPLSMNIHSQRRILRINTKLSPRDPSLGANIWVFSGDKNFRHQNVFVQKWLMAQTYSAPNSTTWTDFWQNSSAGSVGKV